MDGTKFVPPILSCSPPPLATLSPPPLPDDTEGRTSDVGGFSFNTLNHEEIIIGQSAPIKELKKLITVVAEAPTSILVLGETGTGKELVARAIHSASGRTGRLVSVNCAAIPSELIESELFGHVKGSFTSAIKDRVGKFELANGGTLFLDEIGDLSLKAQAKVLGFMDSAQNPVEWPTSPAVGIQKLLQKLSLSKDDIAMWEINEAFAVVVLANAKLLNLDLDKVNINGGAIGLGHPFGMSGARITNHLVHQLKEGEIGIASLCNGGGGASTIAIQKM